MIHSFVIVCLGCLFGSCCCLIWMPRAVFAFYGLDFVLVR